MILIQRPQLFAVREGIRGHSNLTYMDELSVQFPVAVGGSTQPMFPSARR